MIASAASGSSTSTVGACAGLLLLLLLPSLAARLRPEPEPEAAQPLLLPEGGPLVGDGPVRCDLTLAGAPRVPPPSRVVVHGPGRGPARALTPAAAPGGWRVTFTPPAGEGDLVLLWEGPWRDQLDATKLVLHRPVAGEPTRPPGWEQPVGAALELLPLSRPYWLPVGAHLRGQLLRRGSPLARAGVEAAPVDGGPASDVALTDRHGCFGVTLDRAGWWRVSAAAPSDGVARRAHLLVFVGTPPAPDPAPAPRPAPSARPTAPWSALAALAVAAVGVLLAARRPAER